MANIKSQIKRNRTNERNRLRNQSTKSSLRTAIRNLRAATEAGDKEKAGALLVATSRQLDKAASKGVIHQNQAANKKSALAKSVNQL
ncbi:30S ribosomal protein S20 [Dietzia aerolata]|uniref:Small ribosomal subunit protein bS20 n=1 Tax=Dietzia aerolata TaxID=595984 RepID=A0ABV5JLF3_9ACTN|nr:30S ribosomal protein S20 [Dietzia aerolata]